MINLIENFKDEIYMDEENKNLQKKENYTKIGKEKLNSMIKIDQTLEKEINNFIKQPTELIFNFFKLNQSDNFYDTIKICENTYKIESELKLPLKNFVSYNGFESQLNIELYKNNIKKKFLINVTLYTKNFYDISIDIKKEETFSAEIVFVSNQKDLLPNNITISNKILFINDSLLNMKRIILLNITKNDLFNYLEKFSFFNEKKKIDLETNLLSREKETKSKINDLFINIIIRDKDYKKGDITAFPIVKRVLNEFTDDDKMLINIK